MKRNLSEELEQTLAGDLYVSGINAQRHILDSLACQFHNEGWSLDGNRQENDHKWLARRLWLAMHPHCVIGNYDSLSADEVKHWEALSAAAIESLPGLMSRIAYRAVSWSKALRTLERAVRAQNPYRDKPRLYEIGDDFAPCWCGHVRALHGLESCAGASRNHDKKPCNCTTFRSMDTQGPNGEPATEPSIRG